MASELDAYIAKARENKIPDEQIKTTLLNTGWPQEQVTAAFAHPASDIPVPPPPPPPPPVQHVGMWTGFLYIIFFISLYILATATANILHVWVDNLNETPERLYGRSYDTGYLFLHYTPMITGSIAAMIVSYPIFTWLAVYLKNQRDTKIAIRNLRSRKILIYITLIGTFLIMLGHVIATIHNFLTGSGTGNTLGHLLVTIVVAGLIFWYFLSEVKHDSNN